MPISPYVRDCWDNGGDSKEPHRQLLSYLLTLDAHDEVRMREFGYHCILADDKQAFVDYVQDFEWDKQVIPYIARDAHELTIGDGGAWLKYLFWRGMELSADHSFVNFVNFELAEAFGDSQAELELKREVMEAGLAMILRVDDWMRTADVRRDLSVSYEKVGDIYRELGGRGDLAQALAMYQKNLEVAKSLAEEQRTVSAYDELAVIYYKLGKHTLLDKNEQHYFAKQFLEISKFLYEQVGGDRYRRFVNAAQKLLSKFGS